MCVSRPPGRRAARRRPPSGHAASNRIESNRI